MLHVQAFHFVLIANQEYAFRQGHGRPDHVVPSGEDFGFGQQLRLGAGQIKQVEFTRFSMHHERQAISDQQRSKVKLLAGPGLPERVTFAVEADESTRGAPVFLEADDVNIVLVKNGRMNMGGNALFVE